MTNEILNQLIHTTYKTLPVWAVCYGEFGEDRYYILGVYSDKGEAEHVAEHYTDDNKDVGLYAWVHPTTLNQTETTTTKLG